MIEYIKWEIYRHKKKGIHSIIGIVLLAAIFYFSYTTAKALWEPYMEPFFSKSSFNMLLTIIIPVDITILTFYISFDLICKYKLLENYRIEPNHQWTWERNAVLWRAERWDIAITQIIEYGLFAHIMIFGSALSGVPFKRTIDEFPSPKEFLLQWAFLIIVDDSFSYWVHRFYHVNRILYKKFHSVHHLYETFYALGPFIHPLEYTTTILGTSMATIFCGTKIHLFTYQCNVLTKLLINLENHSGFEIPFSPFRVIPFVNTPEFHHHHHTDNDGNYAQFLMIWDIPMGTCKPFFKKLGIIKEKVKNE